MKQVTDPALLAQLNAPPAPTKKVTPAKPVAKKSADAVLRQAEATFNQGLQLLPAAQRERAKAKFYSSAPVKKLRGQAGLPEIRTKKEEVGEIARNRVTSSSGRAQDRSTRKAITQAVSTINPLLGAATNLLSNDVTSAAGAGAEKGMFNLPTRARSVTNYFGKLMSGEDASYADEFAISNEENRIRRDRSTPAAIIGEGVGAVGSGVGAAGTVRLAGRGIAAIPGASGVGNFIQNLTRLETGRRGANAAKIVAAGSSAGAAQMAGEGKDIATGAAIGAIAAPLVVGGFKGAEWVTRPVRDFLRLSSAKSILGRTVSMTREQAEAAAARFRQETGAEPTMFEILPDGDRRAVTKLLERMPDASREGVTTAVRARVGNMPGELASRTAELTAAQQRQISQRIALDLAESRGAPGAPTADEIALAQRATRDPTEMEQVRRTVNQNIMGPLDDRVAYESVNDLIPTNPVNNGNGQIGYEIADDQMAATIRGAAGSLRLRDDIRVQDVTRLLSRLRATADRGGVEGDAAQNAINHIEDIMARDHPDVAAAMARMTEAHAARSRMLEAIPEGRATRLREDVNVGSKGASARGVRQIYDTPEGASGRAIGQRSEIMSDFSGTPSQAVSRANQIAESPGAQEAIARNLGPEAGQGITQASAAQAESLRRLASLRNPRAGESPDVDFGDLAMATALLSPTSLIRTKSQAVGMLLRMVSGIPEGRANQLVAALFSQNRGQMANAMRLLTGAGEQAQRALRDIIGTIAVGAQAASGISGIDEDRGAMEGMMDAAAQTPDAVPVEQGEPGEVTDPELLAQLEASAAENVPYGRSVIESLFPEAEITEDIRDPNSPLGRKNPNSKHIDTDGAVDLRPIPGVTFEEFIGSLEAEGYQIIEAIDEVNNPSGHATGPHWHVVFA